jgi:hypothetical protein
MSPTSSHMERAVAAYTRPCSTAPPEPEKKYSNLTATASSDQLEPTTLGGMHGSSTHLPEHLQGCCCCNAATHSSVLPPGQWVAGQQGFPVPPICMHAQAATCASCHPDASLGSSQQRASYSSERRPAHMHVVWLVARWSLHVTSSRCLLAAGLCAHTPSQPCMHHPKEDISSTGGRVTLQPAPAAANKQSAPLQVDPGTGTKHGRRSLMLSCSVLGRPGCHKPQVCCRCCVDHESKHVSCVKRGCSGQRLHYLFTVDGCQPARQPLLQAAPAAMAVVGEGWSY